MGLFTFSAVVCFCAMGVWLAAQSGGLLAPFRMLIEAKTLPSEKIDEAELQVLASQFETMSYLSNPTIEQRQQLEAVFAAKQKIEWRLWFRRFWRKPLYDCPYCMVSLHSLWVRVVFNSLSEVIGHRQIQCWELLLVIPIASTMAFLITKFANK